MTEKDIKPIPKTILKKIQAEDKRRNPAPNGFPRFYAYLAVWKKELVKVTVAVKHHKRQWYCKQVAVHILHSEECFVKDLEYCYLTGMGFRIGWQAEGIYKTPKWFEDNKWYPAIDNAYDPYAKVINVSLVFKFPEYKYSACDRYVGVDILQYLRKYEKCPQIEYIVKLGLSHLVNSKQIIDKAAMDKTFCKWIAKNRLELADNNLYVSSILKAYKQNKPVSEIDACEKARKLLMSSKENYAEIKKCFNGDIEKFIAYMIKQRIDIKMYCSYLKACKNLNLDMTQAKNLIPHDFKYWRTVRIDQYCSKQAMSDETLKREMYNQFAEVIKKYAPLGNYKNQAYIAYLANTPSELFREGEFLSHCVGTHGYDQRTLRGETLIFFVRRLDEPNVPFVTIEYSLKDRKIVQCRAFDNKEPDGKVIEFVNKKWLPFATKQLEKIAA